jgi:hypothetical protein
MVLAQKQTCRPTEQNRKPRKKAHEAIATWFLTKVQKIHWKKDSLFNKWYWENSISTYRRLKFDPYPCTKINFKLIKELTIRSEILKLLEEKIGKTFQDLGLSNHFLNRTLIAQEIKARINKRNYFKLKASTQEIINK